MIDPLCNDINVKKSHMVFQRHLERDTKLSVKQIEQEETI